MAQLRHKETVESISGALTLHSPTDNILDVDGDLHVAAGLTLSKEVRISGTARVGEDVRLRALKADGDIFIARRVTVERWIDAGRRLVIADEASSGERATAVEEIVVGRGVRFHVLGAPRIRVGDRERKDILPRSAAEGRPAADFAGARRPRIRSDGALIVDGDFFLPDEAVALGDVVARGEVRIGRNALIIGSLHSDKTLTLDPESTVSGSVFAEERMIISPGAVVTEHALTRGEGRILEDVRIGTIGRVTTLMARRGLEISAGALVHGRIVAIGGGVAI